MNRTKQLILILILVALSPGVQAQYRLNTGIGYATNGSSSHGALLDVELERNYTRTFSLPLTLGMGYQFTPGVNKLTFELRKGFRRSFLSGFFLEQSLGIGVSGNTYPASDYWYISERYNVVAHGNTMVWWLMVSANLGLGYDLSQEGDKRNLLWMRTKALWEPGFSGLNQSLFLFQFGYTHTLKRK